MTVIPAFQRSRGSERLSPLPKAIQPGSGWDWGLNPDFRPQFINLFLGGERRDPQELCSKSESLPANVYVRELGSSQLALALTLLGRTGGLRGGTSIGLSQSPRPGTENCHRNKWLNSCS